MTRSILAAIAIAASLAAPASAVEIDPSGKWVDQWGTTFTLQLCGDGTQLCATLNELQGDSRTEENLQYVNQQVMQADQTGPGTWEGAIALNGDSATATVEMKGPDSLTITGCQAEIICSSIDYQRQ